MIQRYILFLSLFASSCHGKLETNNDEVNLLRGQHVVEHYMELMKERKYNDATSMWVGDRSNVSHNIIHKDSLMGNVVDYKYESGRSFDKKDFDAKLQSHESMALILNYEVKYQRATTHEIFYVGLVSDSLWLFEKPEYY